jgi:hypothetical protein
VIWHITSIQKNDIPEIKIVSVTIPISSSEPMCYPPNSSSFNRDRLKKLIVTKMDDRSVYVNANDASKVIYLSKNYSTLAEFIKNCYEALMSRQLVPGTHSIQIMFHNPPLRDMIRPSCDGLWMEFGVFRGATITQIANWKKAFCGDTSQPVYGFDTFSGLPSNWRPGYHIGSFDIPNGTNITVPSNVILLKGLFIDTLPTELRLIDREYQCHTPVSFAHIDCDIYEGARDVLFLLGSRLVSGSIIVFDELFNYPGYEKHEIKALFEFLAGSNLRLIPVGSSTIIDLNTTYDKYTQSFAFVVDLEETA